MSDTIESLNSAAVWRYFIEICRIPRPSKREEKISSYICDFARNHHLEYAKDNAGNILITKPSYLGYDHLKPVVLQSHLDMVCEKNSHVNHDFDADPIIPFIEDGWIRARGTTLGADDGIGIAAQLAVLESAKIEHGPIECLFTVDEESGMTGAHGLKKNFFKSTILLNLDSEDEGELFIGCAGGIDTIAVFGFNTEPLPEDVEAFSIRINGLRGGHSGDDINKGGGNSVKILTRYLLQATEKYTIRLSSFDGGNKRNAIPREAEALFVIPRKKVASFQAYTRAFTEELKSEFRVREPELEILLNSTNLPGHVISLKSQQLILNALEACPHGVQSMSRHIPGLVETSTNLASVKMKDNQSVIITTSQRSSVESAKKDIARQVASVFSLAGAKVSHTEGYPGWTPNPDSEILHTVKKAYFKLFRKEPLIRAIHAGLECGLFLKKYPGLDMISFGPTIKGAHSPDERIHIESTRKFWELLIEVLKNIPARQD